MAYDVVVRGGTVVTASDAFVADLAIQGGRIAAVTASIPEGREEIDARGLLVLPGGVDVHTHLDVEVGGVTTADDFESGTAAAACGGITTICDYAWQRRGGAPPGAPPGGGGGGGGEGGTNGERAGGGEGRRPSGAG